MNNQIHFDSDELYDPSDDSEEEYIPETSADNSDDTDTSEVIESSDQKQSILRCLHLRKTDDIKDRCLSLMEVNSGSSKQVFKRGTQQQEKEATLVWDIKGNVWAVDLS